MSNLQSVQGIYEDFGNGNIPGILDRLAADIEWERNGVDHGALAHARPWQSARRRLLRVTCRGGDHEVRAA